MNFDDSETIVALRDSLERFVEREIAAQRGGRMGPDQPFPPRRVRQACELGVMGLTIPEDYGGFGRDVVATMVVIEELSRRSLAVSVPYIMAACHAGLNIEECGTEAQKRDLLPRIVAGGMLFAYGLTEPDAGADLASVKTRAERDGDTIRTNGAKRFCSGADKAAALECQTILGAYGYVKFRRRALCPRRAADADHRRLVRDPAQHIFKLAGGAR